MTSNRRRQGRLAAVGLAILLIVALSACGSSAGGTKAGAGASQPAAVVKALGNLTTCLSAHGVRVPAPVTRRGVRTTIRNLPAGRQSTVITACRAQIDALLAMRPAH